MKNPAAPLIAVLLLACLASTASRTPAEDSLTVRGQEEPSPSAAIRPPGELRFGVAPYLPEKILSGEYEPLMAHLSPQLGVPIRLVVAEDYEDLLRKLRRAEVDLLTLTPLSYVRAKREDPFLQLLLSEIIRGTTSYTAYIIVHRDSGIDRLEDLQGKRFVFVDRNSASGYLFPYAFLLKNEIDPETFFGEVVFSGNHVRAVEMVAEREADAAAVSSNSLATAREAGIRTRSLRIFKKTGRIPHDAICARAGLDPGLVRRFTELLSALDTRTEQGRQILGEGFGINGWVEVPDGHYAPVREVLDLVERRQNTSP